MSSVPSRTKDQDFRNFLIELTKDLNNVVNTYGRKVRTDLSKLKNNTSTNSLEIATHLIKTSEILVKNILSLVASIEKDKSSINDDILQAIANFKNCLPQTLSPNGIGNEVEVKNEENSVKVVQKNRLSLNKTNGNDSECTVDEEMPFFLRPVPQSNVGITGDEFIAKLKETIEKIQESNDDDSSIWDLKTVQGSPQTNILEDGFESFDTVDIYDSDGTFCEEAESQQKSSKAPAIEVKSEINNDKIENQANRELKKPHFNLVDIELNSSISNVSFQDVTFLNGGGESDLNQSEDTIKTNIANKVTVTHNNNNKLSAEAIDLNSIDIVKKINDAILIEDEDKENNLTNPEKDEINENLTINTDKVDDIYSNANTSLTDKQNITNDNAIENPEILTTDKQDYFRSLNLIPIEKLQNNVDLIESDENSGSLLTLVREEYISYTENIGREDYKEDVDKIYQDILEMSSGDTTEDASSISDNSDDNSNILNRIKELVSNLSDDSDEEIVKKELSINLIDCVKYNKTYESDDEQRIRKKMNEIDRLCNLNTVLRPSKKKTNKKNVKKSKKKRFRKQILSDSTSSYYTSSDSETEFPKMDLNCDLIDEKNSDAEKTFAANLLNNIHSNTDDTDTYISSDSESEKKRKKIQKPSTNSNKEKKQLTEEEKKKKAWRNDPLLKRKILSSDSDDSQSEKQIRKKTKNHFFVKPDNLEIHSPTKNSLVEEKDKEKHEFELPATPREIDTSSDSDATVILDQENKESKIEMDDIEVNGNSDNDGENSDNSDVVYISSDKCIEISDEDDVSEETTINKGKKGRKNIRSLLDMKSLQAATRQANLEEKQRIERLAEIQRTRDSLSQSSQLDLDTTSFILDPMSNPKIVVHPKLTSRLYPHQKDGVLFMWQACYESVAQLQNHPGSGCILAHCMGLGKTFQVITLIHTLFLHKITNTKRVLIVCPLSTVTNWRNEFAISLQNVNTRPFDLYKIADKKDTNMKLDIISTWGANGGVLIMGYEAFSLTILKTLNKLDEVNKKKVREALLDPGPDLVICDEGHLLRNKNAQRTITLNQIKTKRRIALTGTPLQNNLKEYYQMVHFVKPNLLGTLKEFQTNFINPIKNGQYFNSLPRDIKLMKKRTHVLHKILSKTVQRYESYELEKYLPKIIDYAIFIKLHHLQIELYKKFIENRGSLEDVNFLSDYAALKLLSSHPYIIQLHENHKKDKNKNIKEKEVVITQNEVDLINIKQDDWWKDLVPDDVQNKIEYGCKMVVMKHIIEGAEEMGDKVLIFSQSIAEMDCIEHFLKIVGTTQCPNWQENVDFIRMDGRCPPEKRYRLCDAFNDQENKKLRVFIMSHKVGGLGLNLIASNRVILMGVHFNPSYDTQSIYRAYRFGQVKPCYVYRLISLGTMEEKIYQRSVTKQATALRVVDNQQITRHYRAVELQELYKCDFDIEDSPPLPQLPEDNLLSKVLYRCGSIYKYHDHFGLLKNIPNEELNEQELNAAWDEFIKENEARTNVQPPPPRTNVQPPPGEKLFFIDKRPTNPEALNILMQRIASSPTTGNRYKIVPVPSTSTAATTAYPVYLPGLPVNSMAARNRRRIPERVNAYRNVETNSTSKPLQVVQKNSINEHASGNIRKRYENSYSSKKVNQIMEDVIMVD